MSKSLDKLRILTQNLEDERVTAIVEIPADEYGPKMFILTAEQKLVDANVLIEAAQGDLADGKAKDARIKALVAELKNSVAELKAANAEIAQLKS
jgi:hypothetical protein